MPMRVDQSRQDDRATDVDYDRVRSAKASEKLARFAERHDLSVERRQRAGFRHRRIHRVDDRVYDDQVRRLLSPRRERERQREGEDQADQYAHGTSASGFGY